MLRADLRRCVYFWLLCSLIIIIRIKLTDRFTYSLQYLKSQGILRRIRRVSEIVYESRGKLIGGSLSRWKGKRTVDHQRTRVVTFIGVSDGGIRDPTRKRLAGFTGYEIQRERD